jgi:hypothetical protein
MKKIALVVALGVAGLVSGVANAGTATGNFNVNITLHAKCQLKNTAGTWGGGINSTYSSYGSPIADQNNTVIDRGAPAEILNDHSLALTDLNLVYTSFQVNPSTAVTSFDVRCTENLTYDVTLSNDSADKTTASGGSETDEKLNLNYTVNLSATPGYTSGTVESVPNQLGNGSAKSYYVSGTIAADQAGACPVPTTISTATCTNAGAADKTRYVTITF